MARTFSTNDEFVVNNVFFVVRPHYLKVSITLAWVHPPPPVLFLKYCVCVVFCKQIVYKFALHCINIKETMFS